MNRKYKFLNTIVTIYNVLGVLCLVLTVPITLMLLSHLDSSEFGTVTGAYFIFLIGDLIVAFILFATAQLFKLIINAAGDIETIARNTTNAVVTPIAINNADI